MLRIDAHPYNHLAAREQQKHQQQELTDRRYPTTTTLRRLRLLLVFTRVETRPPAENPFRDYPIDFVPFVLQSAPFVREKQEIHKSWPRDQLVQSAPARLH